MKQNLVFFQHKDVEVNIQQASEELGEVEDEISAVNIDKNFNENSLKEESQNLNPLRDENAQLNAKLQRLNLEFEQINEEENRAKNEIEKIKKEIKQLYIDTDREKQIVNDASSNEKRLVKEKEEIVELDKNYIDIEQKAHKSYQEALENLNVEQASLNELSEKIFSEISGVELKKIKIKLTIVCLE